jgi:hypothetical protein
MVAAGADLQNPALDHDRPGATVSLDKGIQSWLGESEQDDKWIFCLTAAMIAA